MISNLPLSDVNKLRYNPANKLGHYESYFLRANHPTKKLAFWVRYTIFSPKGVPSNAIGELWGILFDGEAGKNYAGKVELPFSECTFDPTSLFVKIGGSQLEADKLQGDIDQKGEKLSWNLTYSGDQKPLLDLPSNFYEGGFPKAKALVGLPMATFNGTFTAGGKEYKIDNWIGSQNHNWGEKHTDNYAWGQVAGFDNKPDVFVELATARLKMGPFWTPFMTPVVVRMGEREFAMNHLLTTFGRGSFDYFHWDFKAENHEIKINGRIWAEKDDFVCLPYYNPPGGTKYCLNSKVANCRIEATLNETGTKEIWETKNRAAFEILTDESDHGLSTAF